MEAEKNHNLLFGGNGLIPHVSLGGSRKMHVLLFGGSRLIPQILLGGSRKKIIFFRLVEVN